MDPMQTQDDTPIIYQIGDRVVLQGLQKACHLNGRHGHIGSSLTPPEGRVPVNLDLLDESTPSVLAVKAINLQRESTIRRTGINDNKAAATSRGCIDEQYGRPLCLILDTLRYLAAVHLMGETSDKHLDIEEMRMSGDPTLCNMLNSYLALAWSHWSDSGSFHTPDNKSIFEMAKEWGQVQLQENSVLPPNEEEGRLLLDFVSKAFDDVTSVKSWHVRIHGDFWIVGGNSDGTFLIAQHNHDLVYQCVGLTSALHEMIGRAGFGKDAIPLYTMTLLPAYGRLLYDGVVVATGICAHPKLATTLRAKVQLAQDQGRVVQGLRQLEVEGGSLEGLPTQGKIDKTAPTEQPPPTTEEKSWMAKIGKQSKVNQDDEHWVFRRRGYTEQDNPEHEGVILAAGGHRGIFDCRQGLAPVSTDILSQLAKSRPYGRVMIDDYQCFQRVKFLLDGILEVDYYHPPTPEETAAASARAKPEGL
jgi:hypothetical protein